MPAARLRVALHQRAGETRDPADGLSVVAAAAGRAAAAGARLLVTPEMSLTGYAIGADRLAGLAEPVPGPLTERLAAVAAGHGIAIAAGMAEALPGGGVANTVQVVDRDGTLLAGYRKAHLYGDVDRTAFVPGDVGVVQFGLDGVVVGLLVCYDVEFPEAVRAHAVAGTELLLVPTALMEPFTQVGTVLVPARAYESQLFVAYVNRVGREGPFTYCGGSCVVAPDGTELVRGGVEEELLVAEIDTALLAASRAVNTHLADRRPELYR